MIKDLPAPFCKRRTPDQTQRFVGIRAPPTTSGMAADVTVVRVQHHRFSHSGCCNARWGQGNHQYFAIVCAQLGSDIEASTVADWWASPKSAGCAE